VAAKHRTNLTVALSSLLALPKLQSEIPLGGAKLRPYEAWVGWLQHLPYFPHPSRNATKNPPITERAWKPILRPESVKYRSENGTRLGVSLA
jgi:hypothetical protein